jgi:hypothetical protein
MSLALAIAVMVVTKCAQIRHQIIIAVHLAILAAVAAVLATLALG